MEKLNPYLTFPGNCEEAFKFYKSVFGGEFLSLARFSDLPSDEGSLLPEYKMNKIVHISLPIGTHTLLMGSDSDEDWRTEIISGNNISLSITARTKEDADRYFEHLSVDGKILMQIGDVFWGSYYGVCYDRFGVCWAVCCNNEKK